MKLAYKSQRQLAAIMFTDIVGYTAIMNADEDLGRRMRERHRQVFTASTEAHDGRIIQYFGDGTLSIFHSAIEAVECAIEMQRAFKREPKVPLRIGIHIGDIVHSNEEVFGDGVNIAARIESVCIEGGVFVSGKVFEEIKNHSDIITRSMGKYDFKNVSDEIELFAIVNEGLSLPSGNLIDTVKLTGEQVKIKSILENVLLEQSSDKKGRRRFTNAGAIIIVLVLFLVAAIYQISTQREDVKDVQTAAAVIPNDLSIAVLPFVNLSNEKDHDYLSDGLTEDILTILSKMENVRVVSRTSVMQYKNTKKSIQEIARELKVSNILEGSVQSSGDRLRINAQLIDAGRDAHIWAETYNKEMTELLKVQGEVANDIAVALKTELSDDIKTVIARRNETSIKAYDHYLKGRMHYWKYTDEDNEMAIENFNKALEEESNYALAYAGLGDAYAQRVARYGNSRDWLDSSLAASQKALKIDPQLSEGYKSLGLAFHYQLDFEKALEAYRKAVQFDPGNHMAMANMGAIFKESGDLVNAYKWIKRTISLNPNSPETLLALADINYLLMRDEANEEVLAKGIQLQPDLLELYHLKGFTALMTGKTEEAMVVAQKMIEIDPESLKTNESNGYYRIATRNFKEAIPFFEKARDAENRIYGKEMVNLNEVVLSYLYLKTGEEKVARRKMEDILKRLMREEEKSVGNEALTKWQAAAISMMHAQLGRNEEALRWLQTALDRNLIDYRMLSNYPLFDPLQAEPEYQRMMQTLKQRIDEMRRKVALFTV